MQQNNNRPEYNNANDGHTYYYRGVTLYAAPTWKDGTTDYENEIQVDEFDTPLEPSELETIVEALEAAANDPELDKEPAGKYYSAAGILDLKGYKPVVDSKGELVNESEFFEAAEQLTGNEVAPGDILTVIFTNYTASKATVYAYIVNENFMGGFDVVFYGKRSHDF